MTFIHFNEGGEKLDKRERIIEGAIRVFREKGVHQATISNIVKEAGIAQGTFYLYFESKLSLMPAIAEVMVERTIQHVHETVDEQAPIEQQIRQMIDAIFDINRDYHEIQALIYSGLASTEHLKKWEAVYAPFYEWVSTRLEQAKRDGAIRPTVHPERFAKLMIGLVESAAEQIYLYDVDQEAQAPIQKEEVFDFLQHALRLQ